MKDFDVLNSECSTYKGELVGINVKNDFFAFITDDGCFIRGKLSKAMKEQKFSVPSYVCISMSEQDQVNKLTGEIKKSYTLHKVEGL